MTGIERRKNKEMKKKVIEIETEITQSKRERDGERKKGRMKRR